MSQSEIVVIIFVIVIFIAIISNNVVRLLTKEKKEFLTYLCLLENHCVSLIDREKEFTVEVKRSYQNRELSVYDILINDRIVGVYRIDWLFRIHRYAYFINYEYDVEEVLKLLKTAYRKQCLENASRFSYKKSLYE